MKYTMKPDTDSAAADLLRQIIEEHPNATEDEIKKLFVKALENDEEAKLAVTTKH